MVEMFRGTLCLSVGVGPSHLIQQYGLTVFAYRNFVLSLNPKPCSPVALNPKP